MSVTAIAGAVAAVLCGALGGCSFVLDSSARQCTVDSDCDHFGDHPQCVDNVCVLGPPGCFLGTPTKQSDFLNQCTTSTYSDFNNCNRIGYCDDKQMLPAPTMPSTGKLGAAKPPPAPQNLCTDGAPTDGQGKAQMIWITGSGDFGPLLRAAQPFLTLAGYRGVFQSGSSCQGVTAIYNQQSITDPAMETIGGWAFYYDADGQPVNCRLGPVGTPGSKPVDIGISDVFSKTCGVTPMPGVNPVEYNGPVVPFVLATKAESTQQSISAEAAHFVFGRGGLAPPGMKNAMPWTDYHNYYIRSATGASTILTWKPINVDRSAFWGIDRVTIDNLAASLQVSPDADPAIGILSIDFYDTNRGNLKALYLQSPGQSTGFLPDSTPTTTDRVNVRDGHYPLWGYVHFVVARDPMSGLPSNAANAMILLFNQENLKQELIDSIIGASETPQCAMKVERSEDIGDYTIRNLFSCSCYFDFKTRNGKTDCSACRTSDDCPNKAPCNYGFCEVGSAN